MHKARHDALIQVKYPEAIQGFLLVSITYQKPYRESRQLGQLGSHRAR